MIHPQEIPFRKAKLDQIELAARRDEETWARWRRLDELRPQRDHEARAILGEFWRSGDLAALAKASDAWCKQEGPYETFSGFGQMWLNQVAKHASDAPDVIETLSAALRTPGDLDEALAKFVAVESVTQDLASKGQPAKGRIPLVLSLFWSTDPEDRGWPCLWPSAQTGLDQLGWVANWTNAARYRAFHESAHALRPEDVHQLDRLLWFLVKRQGFVGLNPQLEQMCVAAAEIMRGFERGVGYPDERTGELAEALARQLKGELTIAMMSLLDDVREVAGLGLEKSNLQLKTAFDKDAAYRADAYATWSLPGGMSAPGLRLWATKSGLSLGVYGGWNGTQDDYDARAADVAELLPPGCTFFKLHPHLTGDRLEATDGYPGGEVYAGAWWSWSDVPADDRAREMILPVVSSLAPALDAVGKRVGAVQSTSSTPAPGTADGTLDALLAGFQTQRPYPNDKDGWHESERARLAETLTPENLTIFDPADFRQIINGSRYGNPGQMATLNSTLNTMSSAELDEFAVHLREILHGDGTEADRIDRALDKQDLGAKGMGENVVLKLFALVHPDRFLPVFPLSGSHGKRAMLKRLGLPEPADDRSRGEQHVAANDALRQYLDPYLPGDPWGQGQFLYWLLEHPDADPPEEDGIPQAAVELRVPEAFLREIEDLLKDKGQVIFYGPPGTGKTYIAQRLAEAIQPDPDRVRVVQFHPSMSYEDFFEGFRPRLDSGQLVYELRKGPLALIAEQAEAASGQPHILIIDEINRANLPRVLGELLYLLEYRSKSVYTAYRPDEPFELPKNLFIIGTMNTADRSIAMVDAALRRRFHFIPFMPEEEALSSVLRDWLAAHGEPTWIASMVDSVNARLVEALKGPHLQIGHSHFMVKDAGKGKTLLTAERLERIWKYDIYPFIEDQLYGRPALLSQFTWQKVYAMFGPGSPAAVEAAEVDALDDLGD